MKKFRINIRRELKIALGILFLVLLIAFTERQQRTLDIQDLVIKMENTTGNHFLEEADVVELMGLTEENLRGASLSKLNLKELEDRIEKDRFVSDAEIFSDLKGDLVVRVELRRPIARIIQTDGPDAYLAEDGTIMPVQNRYPSRVTLVSGRFTSKLLREENLNNIEDGMKLMNLLELINGDEFWRAQIAQLDIDQSGLVTIYSQVSKQLVEFGNMDNREEKLKKL